MTVVYEHGARAVFLGSGRATDDAIMISAARIDADNFIVG